MTEGVDLQQLAISRDRGHVPGPRRRVVTRYVLPAALLLGFLSLVAWASRDLVFPPRPVRVVPVLATLQTVRSEGTPLFQAAGWIEPRPTPIRVAALAPGVVERLLVVEDQPIKAGEPVAELVKDDAKLVWDRARADLSLREAELEEARAAHAAALRRIEQPVHLDAQLAEAESGLAKIRTELATLPFERRRAEADRTAARREYESRIAARGVVPSVEIEVAQSKLSAAEAMVEELDQRVVSLQGEERALVQRRDALQVQRKLLIDETRARDVAAAGVSAASARVEQARVGSAEAKLQLDRMTVRAPVTGRVYRLLGHPGARIGGGGGMTEMAGHDASTVVTLYQPGQLQVRVDVRFEDLPKVQLNQPVEIGNPALPKPLRGTVLFVSSEADIQKNTLQVKVSIPDPPALFKPEMLVDVTFLAPAAPAGQSEQTPELKLYVEQGLVRQVGNRSVVWIADQSAGVARSVTVETGTPGANGLVEIISGLDESSRLISSETESLRDGDRIEIVGEGERTSPSLAPAADTSSE